MSMTPETPTPETDAVYPPHIIDREFAEQGRSFGWGTLHDMRECSRQLERERDAARAKIEAMREAIREAASHLSGFLGFYADGLTLEQVRALSATLGKLQPLLTDASHPNT